MAEKILLDTNIVIALFKNEQAVVDYLAAKQLHLPSVVLGELYFGAQRSQQVQANWARAKAFVAKTVILVCDEETAEHYGRLKHQLQLKGRPIPENDIWIAALARQHELSLLTRDRHFQDVDGLVVEAR